MTTRPWKAALACALATLAAHAFAAPRYDPGADDKTVKIGSHFSFSGPAAYYGGVGRVAQAYFDMVNARGGVNGRKIDFIAMDDAYNPAKAVEAVRKLVESDGVLAMVMSQNTPTNLATQKYLNEAKVPQLFLISPISHWNEYQKFPWSMTWSPTADTEAAAYATYIRRNIPNAKIAILHQNDDFGREYIKGLKRVLGADYDKLVVKTLTYESTDATIESQIIALQGSGANVFVNASQQKFAAQAIRKMADIGWKPTHFLTYVSASPTAVFQPAGAQNSAGIISAVFLKDPGDPAWKDDPGVKQYLAFMKERLPSVNPSDWIFTQAYSIAQTFEYVLQRCGDDLTRVNLMKQAANIKDLELPLLLPGIKVNTSPTDWLPVQDWQLVRFDGKTLVRVGDVIKAPPP